MVGMIHRRALHSVRCVAVNDENHIMSIYKCRLFNGKLTPSQQWHLLFLCFQNVLSFPVWTRLTAKKEHVWHACLQMPTLGTLYIVLKVRCGRVEVKARYLFCHVCRFQRSRPPCLISRLRPFRTLPWRHGVRCVWRVVSLRRIQRGKGLFIAGSVTVNFSMVKPSGSGSLIYLNCTS